MEGPGVRNVGEALEAEKARKPSSLEPLGRRAALLTLGL